MTSIRHNRPPTARSAHAAVAVLALLLFPGALPAQEAPAAVTPAEGSALPAHRIRLAAAEGGRAAWAPRGDWIAFDREESGGRVEVFVAKPDFSLERCLTCPLHEFRGLHVGSPAWHPGGRTLVVRAEKPIKRGGEPHRYMEFPGGNLGDDLYAVAFDGKGAWNLTNLAGRGGRVLSPHFSHEGDRLAWSERIAAGDGTFGRWALRVAPFEVKRGVPRLGRVRTFRPGDNRLFYEAHAFTTDDRGLILSGNLEAGQPEGGMDLYVLRLESEELRRLTSTPDELDRWAAPSPNGRWIVWSTSRGIGDGRVRIERQELSAARPLDLWMMRGDGSGAARLTRFNDVFAPEYAGPTMARAVTWSPEGDRLLLHTAPVASPDPGSLYLIEFEEPIGR